MKNRNPFFILSSRFLIPHFLKQGEGCDDFPPLVPKRLRRDGSRTCCCDPNFRKVALNALLWISKLEVPKDGVGSVVSETEMKQNLDPKK